MYTKFENLENMYTFLENENQQSWPQDLFLKSEEIEN